MRILVVYPYVPFPLDRGTYQRTYNLLRVLAVGHDIDLFALSEDKSRLLQLSHFESFCSRVKFIPFDHPKWPRLSERFFNMLPTTVQHWRSVNVDLELDSFISGRQYDLVYCCDIVMGQYFLSRLCKIPLVIDRSRVDLEFQLAQAKRMSKGVKQGLLDAENIFKLKRFERIMAKRATLEVVCGEDDAEFVKQHIDNKLETLVVVNGVDEKFFDPKLVSFVKRTKEPTILFCGAMDYTPNIDALRWYFGEIHDVLVKQCPLLQVFLVGRSPISEVLAYGKLPNVIVTGSVEDVRPFYRMAWAQIVPLRIGGGSRLKIPESLIMGCPVVSTTIGAQGLMLEQGKEIILADTASDFAKATSRLLSDFDLQVRLAGNGGNAVKSRLTWRKLGAFLSAKFDSLHVLKGMLQ